ncbi:zinc finger, CCHC-type, retrotransposon gag domain protein [Tanacetum coccineum]
MIEGIVTNMATVADMATGTDMALTDGVVIDRAVTDMVMVVTDREMVVRRRGVTKISRFGDNIIVVLMVHQARADTRIITHIPHVTFVGNFIQERRVTGLLVLALNVRVGVWLKIVRKVVRAAGKNVLCDQYAVFPFVLCALLCNFSHIEFGFVGVLRVCMHPSLYRFTKLLAQPLFFSLRQMSPRRSNRVNNEGLLLLRSASTPVEAENWIAHIKKIFEVLECDDQFKARLVTYKSEGDAHSWWRAYKQAKGGDAYVATLLAGFLGAKAGTQEEQAKHFKWGLNDFVLDKILNTEFTDVAQVANAAINIEIFRSNPRADDRRDSDKYGNRGRHGNRDRYGTDRWCGDRQGSDRHGNGSDRQGNGSQKAWRDQDQQVRGQHYSRSYGSSSKSGYPDYNSYPPCNLCGKFHPGKACHRATGACFECGEVGHLAKDCKKGSTSSGGKRFDNLKREYYILSFKDSHDFCSVSICLAEIPIHVSHPMIHYICNLI